MITWKRGPQASNSRNYDMNENQTTCVPNYTFTKESHFHNTKGKEGQVVWEKKMSSFIISTVENGKATPIGEIEVNMAEYINSVGQTQRINFDTMPARDGETKDYPGLYIEVRWLICEKDQYEQQKA